MNDDSGVSRAEPTFALGEVVAERYMIARFIAQGGMGEVYEADDLELNERVALKVVKAEFEAGDEAHERFRREVQLARRVTHPNVCRLYDLVRATTKGFREVTFLTMEFLPGETLAERLRRVGRLGTREALPLARQMASALDAAHKAGVIHRDFKTANVVLVPDAAEEGSLRAVVTDFGLARAERRTGTAPANMTGVGLVVGTASYMSPEQAEGADVTPATDVYALGVVLYEMVTGALPHAAHSTLSMLLKRLREPAPSPRELVPDIDPRWEAAILRCLERVPSRRFARAREVIRAIEGRGEDESSASDTRVTREMDSKGLREAARLATPRPGERVTLPRRGLLLGAGLLVLALFAAIFASRRRPAALPFDRPNPVQLTTSAGLDVFPSFSPDGESIAYSSDEAGGFSLFVKQLAPGGRSIALTPGEDRSVQPSWSPDGARIAYHSDTKGGIWIIPALGGTAKQLVDYGAEPSFSPDGKDVAFTSDSQVPLGPSAIAAHPPATLFAVPADGGVPRRLTRPGEPPGGHGAPVYTPDGKSVVFTASTNQISEIWSVEIATGKLTRLVSGVIAYDPVVTSDGRSILYA
ncbi:MAG TPA: protein kinase, partial [Thermoanaerobaculia bacterium]|nr:protein kinase [Thermoanaerobaculia bacterium]